MMLSHKLMIYSAIFLVLWNIYVELDLEGRITKEFWRDLIQNFSGYGIFWVCWFALRTLVLVIDAWGKTIN